MNIKFGFLTSLGYLMGPSKDGDIAMKIHHLTETYDDIITSELQREIRRIRGHIKTAYERSFSMLKLIKTYLRCTMSPPRLSHPAILSIERELAESIDFEAVMVEFASLKARKI